MAIVSGKCGYLLFSPPLQHSSLPLEQVRRSNLCVGTKRPSIHCYLARSRCEKVCHLCRKSPPHRTSFSANRFEGCLLESSGEEAQSAASSRRGNGGSNLTTLPVRGSG